MTVYLVGAGPGDPGLMTARAFAMVGMADVIIHDRLVPPVVLDWARPDAELIYVGKQGGGESTAQAEIERLLVEHGRTGRTVVRLKGGDPFVFGRGGEEAEALREAGVEFEVVPGVTAGVGASAYAGIPVTHRELASAVAFVTGHEDPAKAETALDWEALATFPGTLVVYMGVRQLESVAHRLIAAGRDADQPAAVIERGTMPEQRVVTATLGTIADAAQAEQIGAPAVAVFGRVVELRERLGWFELRPLSGVSVAVTRARTQASELASRLTELGAIVVEVPAIRIVPLDGPAPDLSRYDLLCLSSPNGVGLLFERMAREGKDARALAGLRIAAIGPGTAAALRSRGVIADVVPERSIAEGLVEALAELPFERALIARATEARDTLPEALRERGEVDVIPLYETVAELITPEGLAAAERADYVTFTSSSTVRFFLDAVGDWATRHPRLVSIGPVTSAALRARGLEPDLEAERHDIDGVIEALVRDVAARRAATPAA